MLALTAYILQRKAEEYLPDASQITNEESINDYLKNHWFSYEEFKKNPNVILVPTGVFIESLEFSDSNTVHMSGYIWQKYKNENKDISRGVVFPEGIDVTIEKAFHREEKGFDVHGWYFEASFIQPFDYDEFPFDHKLVWIRMWHKDFDKNVVLVPDLSSYDSTLATDKFGLCPEIVLAGFDIEETFFKFAESRYDTNFGINNYIGKKGFPELTYNIALKRKTSDALIIYILPILAVFVLLFFSITMLTSDEKLLDVMGFNFSDMTNLGALFLFLVILSHIQLRSNVTSQSIMFIEYLYFLAYASITWMVLASFIVSNRYLNKILPILYAHNCIYIKAIFPPILCAVFLYLSLTQL